MTSRVLWGRRIGDRYIGLERRDDGAFVVVQEGPMANLVGAVGRTESIFPPREAGEIADLITKELEMDAVGKVLADQDAAKAKDADK